MYITDISLDVLQDLDISALRGQGIQPGEEKLPEEVQQTQSKGLFLCHPWCWVHCHCLSLYIFVCKLYFAMYAFQNQNKSIYLSITKLWLFYTLNLYTKLIH